MRTPGFDKFVWNKFEQLNAVKLAPKGWSTWMYGIILYPQPINNKGLVKSDRNSNPSVN
jgi:hypothetical protein